MVIDYRTTVRLTTPENDVSINLVTSHHILLVIRRLIFQLFIVLRVVFLFLIFSNFLSQFFFSKQKRLTSIIRCSKSVLL
jgi:hypothetical protein